MKQDPIDNQNSKAHTISKIFNYVGGTLVFFGILYLLFDNVFLLATASHILVSLGLAIWSLAIAISLSKQERAEATSAVFYTIGGILLPIGLGVTLNAMQLDVSKSLIDIIITGICFTIFSLLQLRFPREVLLIFTVFFGSSFFISGTDYLNPVMADLSSNILLDYQLILLGGFYLILGYIAAQHANRFTGMLYFIGDLLLLIGIFNQAGYLFDNSNGFIWEIFAPAAVLLSFILSIPLRSNSLLNLGGLFLIVWVVNLSKKFAYLFGSIEWPVLLIAAGVVLMIVGYLFVHLQGKIPKK